MAVRKPFSWRKYNERRGVAALLLHELLLPSLRDYRRLFPNHFVIHGLSLCYNLFMGKAKNLTKKYILITAVVLSLVSLAVIIVFTQTKKYVGVYNLDDRYSIILKQDGTCDFTESGVSAYTSTELKCYYKVENTSVAIERDVRRYSYSYLESTKAWGDAWMPGSGCAQFNNKPGKCEEEITRIQETAIIGDTEMLYKDKVYIKLK